MFNSVRDTDSREQSELGVFSILLYKDEVSQQVQKVLLYPILF